MNETARQDWEWRREIRLPFELELSDGAKLRCRKLLRVLPGRRLVLLAQWGGQRVLLKLFMGANCQREAQADAVGVKALMNAGIATPPLLQELAVAGKNYPVLLFEFIEQAVSFRQRWQRVDSAQQEQMLRQVVEMMAVQHEAGLYQRDFHLNNFIFDAQGRLFAIDGGDYVVQQQALGRRLSVQNLGLLFGHLAHHVLPRHAHLLDGYQQLRGWTEAGFRRRVERAATAFRHRRATRISRKAFRNCSEFLVRRQEKLRICQRRDFSSAALDAWLQTTHLEPQNTDTLLKRGNSQTVWKTAIDGRELVVKRYNLKNRLHAWRRAFSRSRASRSWENAHRLRAYHIATPEPLAMIEERRGWRRRRAWLLTAVAPGQGANRQITALHQQQIAALAQTVKSFADNGIAHGDMKATNFIVDDAGGVQVIDLDSMSRPRLPWRIKKAIRTDQQRFLQNWSDPALKQRFAALLQADAAR